VAATLLASSPQAFGTLKVANNCPGKFYLQLDWEASGLIPVATVLAPGASQTFNMNDHPNGGVVMMCQRPHTKENPLRNCHDELGNQYGVGEIEWSIDTADNVLDIDSSNYNAFYGAAPFLAKGMSLQPVG
jgi:hypothetical protein